MTDNSIEKRLSGGYRVSTADWHFIEAMRRAASNGVGYGFMQQVTEWEWQDADNIGAWGPEYFEKEIERLTTEVSRLSAYETAARWLIRNPQSVEALHEIQQLVEQDSLSGGPKWAKPPDQGPPENLYCPDEDTP